MAPEKTAFIVNPNAGNRSTGGRWPEIRTYARRRLGPFAAHVTSGPGDAEYLARALLNAGVRRLVAVGGDGTLNEVVNGWMAVRPEMRCGAKIGFIPNGTGCDFVRTVPIPRNPERAVDLIAAGSSRAIDLGRIDFRGPKGRLCRRYFHNIASFGLGGEVDARVNRTSKALGPFLSFIWATLASVLEYGPKKLWLKIDDGPVRPYVIWNVAVANCRFHGGGMWVAPAARPDDGCFDLTVVGNLSLAGIFANLPRLYNGGIAKAAKVVCHRGRRVEAFSSQRVLLDVDGEQPGRLPAVLEIVPGALQVIAGPRL